MDQIGVLVAVGASLCVLSPFVALMLVEALHRSRLHG